MGLVRTSLLGAGLAAGLAGLVLMIALGDGGFVIVCAGGFVLVLAGILIAPPGTAPRGRKLLGEVRPAVQPAPDPEPAPEPEPAPTPEPEAEVTPPKPQAQPVQAKPETAAPAEAKPAAPRSAAPSEPVPAPDEPGRPASVPLPDPAPPSGAELLVGRVTQVAGSPAVVAGVAALSAGAVVLARRLMRR